MFRSFPSHIVLAVLLVGCSDDDSSDPKGDVGDTLGLTDTSDTIDPALRVDASIDEGGVQTCADSSLRNEAHFDRGVSPTPPNSDLWIWAGGEMAGDYATALMLFGLGFDTVSVSPHFVAEVKHAVRQASRADLEQLATRARAAKSGAEVRAALEGLRARLHAHPNEDGASGVGGDASGRSAR